MIIIITILSSFRGQTSQETTQAVEISMQHCFMI